MLIDSNKTEKRGKKKQTAAGAMKQKSSSFSFTPGHFHMSPLLSLPSITFHSGQDSCL